MSIPTFTPGYPPDGASLGQTKATIRNNLDGTFDTLGIDHVNNNGQPGTNPAGYHTVIHSVPQAGDPAAITGYGQLYSKNVTSIPPNSDTALFWETSAGLIQQLTVNLTPKLAENGYSFLPGGLIFQWGIKTVAVNTTTPLLFATDNINFPNACFNVNITGIRTNSGGDGIFLLAASIGPMGFTFRNGSGSITQAYWTAIGN